MGHAAGGVGWGVRGISGLCLRVDMWLQPRLANRQRGGVLHNDIAMIRAMLTPMQVQYLVGLLCCRHSADSVQVMLGDMVDDPIAAKQRDVDVTITGADQDGIATKVGLEVKREGQPLDLPAIESLVCKLNDMPSLTSRGVVSASGFAKPALRKLRKHGLTPFHLVCHKGSLADLFPSFRSATRPVDKYFTSVIQNVTWGEIRVLKLNPLDECREDIVECVRRNDNYYESDDPTAKPAGSINSFFQSLLQQITGKFKDDPAVNIPIDEAMVFIDQEESARKRKIVPLNANIDFDKPFFLRGTHGSRSIHSVRIECDLVNTVRRVVHDCWVMMDLNHNRPFGAASVAELPLHGGFLLAAIISPHDQTLQIAPLRLAERHTNAIRRLRLQ